MTKDRRRRAMDRGNHEKKGEVSRSRLKGKKGKSRLFSLSVLNLARFRFRAAASFFLVRLLFEFIAVIFLSCPRNSRDFLNFGAYIFLSYNSIFNLINVQFQFNILIVIVSIYFFT